MDFLYSLINFLILFGVLFFFTRKMIRRKFRTRSEEISGGLDSAEKAREDAARLGALAIMRVLEAALVDALAFSSTETKETLLESQLWLIWIV